MTDQNDPGNGWWQASDGKWYPPDTHPDYVSPAGSAPPVPSTGLPVAPSLPAPADPSPGPQFVPATPAPATPQAPASPTAPSTSSRPLPGDLALAGARQQAANKKLLPFAAALPIAAAAAAVVAVIAALAFVGSNDDVPLIAGQIVEDVSPQTAAPVIPSLPDPAPDASPDPIVQGADPASPSVGSLANPFGYDALVPVEFDVFGAGDGSMWNVRLSPPRDITAEVLAANDFNDPPLEGVIFVGFDAELTLASANKEPLSTGFNVDFEILGGATNAVYDERSFDGLFGCGLVKNEFDQYAEAFVGGTLAGVICIPLPIEDLAHPETQLSMNMRNVRLVFGADGATPAPLEIGSRGQIADSLERGYDASVPVSFDEFGDPDGSVWNIRIGAPQDVTDMVLAANRLNDPPPDGVIFAGFDAEMTLASANEEPLAAGYRVTWEIVGGATARVYDYGTIDDLYGCGSFTRRFDDAAEAFVGGTVSGVVCVPLPAEDLNHPDTRVSIHVQRSRVVFVDGGETPEPVEVSLNGGPPAAGRAAPLDEPIDLVWDTYGDADGSVWTTTVGKWADISDEVVAANPFNNPPPPGVVYAGFPIELSLVSAPQEPLASGFSVSWEILGGATRRVYNETSFADIFGCGVIDDGFDHLDEVFVGGTLTGTICVPLPVEDLDHPDTRISLGLKEGRIIFGPN